MSRQISVNGSTVSLDVGLPVSIDAAAGVITICGIRYSFELFEAFGALGGALPLGSLLRIVARDDGVVTVERIEEQAR